MSAGRWKRLVLFCGASLLLGALCVQPAFAQDDQVFNPTSGWLVGPARVAAQGDASTVPCLMLDQYENGFTFRFSGGDGKILAIAIDFRQEAFRAGQRYPLTVSIDKHFTHRFDAPAYDDSVLIVSAQDAATATGLYKALADGQQMTLGLGKQTIDFTLLGTSEGLQRLEACYGISPRPLAEHLGGAGPAIPKIVVHPASPPPSLGGIDASVSHVPADIQGNTAISRPPADDAAVPATLLSAQSSSPAGIVSGIDGGPDAAQAAPPPALTQAPTPTPPPAGSRAADSPGDAPVAGAGNSQWRVAAHAGLHATLSAWSDQRGADLIWQFPGDLPVPESLTMNGSYEQAVQALLTEYENANPRPAGGLIIDPATGRRQLTIRAVGQ